VVIWADNDSSRVGFNGAGELARIVFESGWRGRLDVVQPPPDVKDFRKWVNCGATRQDVLARVEAARSGRITAGATS
jgi:hypothetical protein